MKMKMKKHASPSSLPATTPHKDSDSLPDAPTFDPTPFLNALCKDSPKSLQTVLRGVLPHSKPRVRAQVAVFFWHLFRGEIHQKALNKAGMIWGHYSLVMAGNAPLKGLYEEIKRIQGVTIVHEKEGALHERGVRGWEEPVYWRGEQVGLIRRFSDKCLLKSLEAEKPEKYREQRDQAQVNVGVSISFTSVGVTRDPPAAIDTESAEADNA